MTPSPQTLEHPPSPQLTANWLNKAVYLRDLVYELVARDVKIQYKRSSIGILWSLLNPLFQFFVFGFLFTKVFAVNVPRYSTYTLTGLLVWTWFQAALLQGVRCITGNRELVKRPGFPVAVLPVVSVLAPWVQFLYALPVLLVFLVISKTPVALSLLLLPMLMFFQALLSLGMVYLLAALNVAFRDTNLILGVLMQVLLFATPIFYQRSNIPARYQFLYSFNPLARLVDAYRDVILNGKWPDFSALMVLLGIGALLFALTFRVFVRMSHRFAEEL